MTTVLVTGANRGLGLEFVRQYANDGAKVIACAREPDRADALQKLAKDNDKIDILALDIPISRLARHWASGSRAKASISSSTMPVTTVRRSRAPTKWTSRAGPTRSR